MLLRRTGRAAGAAAMEYLGYAKINWVHAKSPVALQTKDGKPTDLKQICEESTPICRLNPLLFNGHIQTMWTAVKDDGPPVFYKRKIFDADDPAYEGTFAVDFVTAPFKETDDTLPSRTTYFSDDDFEGIASLDDRPMLVTLHGLSGGSHEVYLRHVLAPLIGSGTDGGWEACVVNSRGCANHKITSSVLYNARATWDIRQTVKWLRKTFPNRPLFGIGFSLGANIITNYIGEEGPTCPLLAAVVVSSPWNLDIGNHCLQRTFLGREVYSKTMGSNMKRLFELHVAEVSKNPKLDVERIRKTRYLHEFDREVQGPTWGYPTEGAYYRDASSVDALLNVRIPLFAINAVDDPIASHESIPYNEFQINPYTILCTTSLGGHLSWFEIGGHRWHARPCVNFLNNMAFNTDLKSLVKPDAETNGDVKARAKDAVFDPVRRKLHFRE